MTFEEKLESPAAPVSPSIFDNSVTWMLLAFLVVALFIWRQIRK